MTNQEINEAVAKKLGYEYHDYSCSGGKGYGAWLCPEPHWFKTDQDKHACGLKDYCGDIRAAWEIVELMKNQNSFLSVDWDSSHEEKWFCTNGHNGASADTAPMAICLAFLKLP